MALTRRALTLGPELGFIFVASRGSPGAPAMREEDEGECPCEAAAPRAGGARRSPLRPTGAAAPRPSRAKAALSGLWGSSPGATFAWTEFHLSEGSVSSLRLCCEEWRLLSLSGIAVCSLGSVI